LIVPCKGIDLDFESMATAVLSQDYPAYRVTFVVESQSDPAWSRLVEILPRFPQARTRLLIAGTARACGQKVHNLLVATERLDPAAAILAFMDSDIRPAADWLNKLVSNLSQEKFDAVTGYRWFVPQDTGWASTVLSALNASVAGMLGNHGMNVVWGGTWAIRRRTFEELQVRQRWQGTLSDDLVVYRTLREAGLKTAFEPACLAPSSARFTWGGLVEFARRQYLITRVYAPGLWILGVLGGTLSVATFWGGLALCWALAGQGWWTTWLTLPPALHYSLSSLRAWMRQSCARRRLPEHAHALGRVAWLDIWLHPFLALLNLGCWLSAAVGRTITWRSIRYRLVSRRETRLETPPATPAPFPFRQAA
jgi:cellulose synthase/poly-beta-1,6-N-acetylglucosamine synthase-like glycosyltransferase